MLPVRNTFLHFPDAEAPSLKRSVTAPLTGATKVDDNGDGRWSARVEEDDSCDQALHGEYGFERPEQSYQPCLERVVTRDPFESPCSSVGTVDGGVSGAQVAACMPSVPPQSTKFVLESYAIVQQRAENCRQLSSGVEETCGGSLHPHHLDVSEPAWTSEAVHLGAKSKAVIASADGVAKPSQGKGGIASARLSEESQRTTVMLRNLPNNYTRAILLRLLDSEGFAGKYDFVYLPIDFRTHAALGYAFVNLVSPEQAACLHWHFDGFSKWMFPSSKRCSVSWSNPHQGLDSHIARYRNSPLMHEVVPDEYRPVLYREGQRIPFPPPTKKIKFPRKGTERMLVGATGGA